MEDGLERRILSIIFFIVFVDLIGFGILIPVITVVFADPASSYYMLPKGTPLSMGYILLGLLLATYSIMQFLAAPILGQLSDKYGRKRLLAISVAGTCLSYLLFALGLIISNIPLLFFSRAIDGITGGNISIAQASIADVTKPENRAKNFGLIGAAFGLGFIIGPFLGGVLSEPKIVSWFTSSTPFFFAALLSFIETLLVIFVLPETIQKVSDRKLNIMQSLSNIKKSLKSKSIRGILSTIFLYQAGFTFFTTFIAVYYIGRFGWTQGDIGNMFAFVGICVAITQLFVLRRLPHNKEHEILGITLLGSGIMLLVYVFPTAPWQLLFIIPIFSLFNGITMAYLPAIVSRSADSNIQGEVLGMNSSVVAIAQAIPPLIAGFFAAQISPAAPLYVAAVIVLSSAALFWQIRKHLSGGKEYKVVSYAE